MNKLISKWIEIVRGAKTFLATHADTLPPAAVAGLRAELDQVEVQLLTDARLAETDAGPVYHHRAGVPPPGRRT